MTGLTSAIRPLRKQNFRHPDDVDRELEARIAELPVFETGYEHICLGPFKNYAKSIKALSVPPGPEDVYDFDMPVFEKQGFFGTHQDIPRLLTFKETVLAIVERYNLTKVREHLDFDVLFLDPLYTCTSIVNKAGTNKYAIIDVCPRLVLDRLDEGPLTTEYDKDISALPARKFDAVYGNYEEHLGGLLAFPEDAFLCAVDGDTALWQEYRKIVQSKGMQVQFVLGDPQPQGDTLSYMMLNHKRGNNAVFGRGDFTAQGSCLVRVKPREKR